MYLEGTCRAKEQRDDGNKKQTTTNDAHIVKPVWLVDIKHLYESQVAFRLLRFWLVSEKDIQSN
jgi:hypothetical protein